MTTRSMTKHGNRKSSSIAFSRSSSSSSSGTNAKRTASLAPSQEFSSESSPSSSAELAIPPQLQARCQHAYGWTDELASRSLKGYRQFMKLKVDAQEAEETAGKELAPPSLIESVWVLHIAHVGQYIQACQDYNNGQVIDYNPGQRNEEGEDAWNERVQFTITVMAKSSLEDIDSEVWNFDTPSILDRGSENTTANHSSNKRKRTEDENDNDDNNDAADDEDAVQPAPMRQRIVPPAPQPGVSQQSRAGATEALTIFVRQDMTRNPANNTNNGDNALPMPLMDVYFRILPTTKMSKVFVHFASHRQCEPQEFSFLFGNRLVQGQDTAASLGLVTGNMLIAMKCASVVDDDDDDHNNA